MLFFLLGFTPTNSSEAGVSNFFSAHGLQGRSEILGPFHQQLFFFQFGDGQTPGFVV